MTLNRHSVQFSIATVIMSDPDASPQLPSTFLTKQDSCYDIGYATVLSANKSPAREPRIVPVNENPSYNNGYETADLPTTINSPHQHCIVPVKRNPCYDHRYETADSPTTMNICYNALSSIPPKVVDKAENPSQNKPSRICLGIVVGAVFIILCISLAMVVWNSVEVRRISGSGIEESSVEHCGG